MSMIFAALGVPKMYQHRVLFWGILGAIVLRGAFILMGAVIMPIAETTGYMWFPSAL